MIAKNLLKKISLLKSIFGICSKKSKKIEAELNFTIKFLTKESILSRVKIFSHKKNCPWVLLIGAQGAGKTSLIKQAAIDFTSPNAKTLRNIRPTKNIDWWVSPDVVVIDSSARMFKSKKPDDQAYWEAYLQALSKKVTRPIDSVCLVIDLPTLMDPCSSSFQNLTSDIQRQLELLESIESPICLSIAITQCDYILGFAEFFNNLSPEDQQQAFGFSIIDSEQCEHFTESFLTQFNLFIDLINKKLIKCLHHEPNLERRIRLSDFPMQLERLLGALNKVFDSLPESTGLVVNDLFFTSSKQTRSTIDFLSQDLKKGFYFACDPVEPLVADQKAFFIPGMLQKLKKPFVPQKTYSILETEKKPKRIIYLTCFIILSISLMILYGDYRKNRDSLKETARALSVASNPGPLSELDKLYELQKTSMPISTSLISFPQAKRINKEVSLSYKKALHNQYGMYLQSLFAKSINEKVITNSATLYDALKAYLMLVERDKLQVSYVKKWLAHYWKKAFPQDDFYQKRLQHYLDDYLELNQPAWRVNQRLVTDARVTLEKKPLAELTFEILQDNFAPSEVAVKSPVMIQGIDLMRVSIPNLYSKESFSAIYHKIIPNMAKTYSKWNWVLGKESTTQDNKTEIESALRKAYVSHYIRAWQKSLAKITFKTPSNYKESTDQINLIINIQSPIWQLYQDALTSARKAGAEDMINEYLSTDDLSARMNDQSDNGLLQQTLQPLRNEIAQIENSPSLSKKSYDVTSKYFSDPDEENAILNILRSSEALPLPLKEWVKQITLGFWKLTLTNTTHYIDTLWKTNVFQFYEEKIKEHYPVFSRASTDIKLNDFYDFFGPGGVIQQSFNLVKPFIDMSDAYWTWKKINNESLNISQRNLDMIIRASMIQKMFYTNNPSKINLQFSLTPIEMSNNASQFIINIGGQMIRYLPGLQKTEDASWPGSEGNFVTIRFSTIDNKNPDYTTTGAWAWLRMLQHTKIQPTSNPHNFLVTFKLQENKVIYRLYAKNAVNPYLPDVLDGFRLPESLSR